VADVTAAACAASSTGAGGRGRATAAATAHRAPRHATHAVGRGKVATTPLGTLTWLDLELLPSTGWAPRVDRAGRAVSC